MLRVAKFTQTQVTRRTETASKNIGAVVVIDMVLFLTVPGFSHSTTNLTWGLSESKNCVFGYT